MPISTAPPVLADAEPRLRPAPRPRRIAALSFPSPAAVVVAVCVGLPVLAAALTGNLVIPHSDAWSMSRIAETFARTGQIHLLGWNDMNLIGQVVMLGPLGRSLVVQQLAVAALSGLCLLAVDRLLRGSVSRRDALLGVTLLGVWPGWASLSTSFLTDVPAFAATFAALLCGRRALRRDSPGWLLAAAALSLWAVSIREQAIAAPAAILVCAWFTRRTRRRLDARVLIAATLVTGAALIAFELWRWALPFGQDPHPTVGAAGFVAGVVFYATRSYLTLALCLAPAVLLGAARHRWSRRDLGPLLAGVLVVAAALACGGPVGRYLSPRGEYFQVLPGVRSVIPADAWAGLLALGALSGTLFVPLARAHRRSVDPLLAAFTILSAVEIVLVGATGNGVWDRYLPALLPGAVALALAPARGALRVADPRLDPSPGPAARGAADGLRVAALASLVVLALVAAGLTANAFAFDAARWHAAEGLARTGTAPVRIDAGMEWDGWHSAAGVRYPRTQIARPGGWELAMSRRPACVALVSSPATSVAGSGSPPVLDRMFTYATYLIGGRSTLYAYRTDAAGCGS